MVLLEDEQTCCVQFKVYLLFTRTVRLVDGHVYCVYTGGSTFDALCIAAHPFPEFYTTFVSISFFKAVYELMELLLVLLFVSSFESSQLSFQQEQYTTLELFWTRTILVLSKESVLPIDLASCERPDAISALHDKCAPCSQRFPPSSSKIKDSVIGAIHTRFRN